eukprot:136951_1
MTKTNISPVAKPMADKKLTKKCYKLIKKAIAHDKKGVCRGIKEVQKSIQKKKKGVCVLAGNIFPIDVLTHLPILCEENDVKYAYVPSKHDLGTAANSKRPTSCMLIHEPAGSEKLSELYKSVRKMMKKQEITF